MTIEQLYEIYLRHPSIRTDTRQLKKGDLFFALKGPNFNGNSFAARALELGAAYAIIDEPPQHLIDDNTVPPYISDRLIVVPDTLQTLQDLALHHRRQFSIPFIAITGSNGKTTTKELIHAVLSSNYITYTTQGNLNNHIGIPLTILSVRADAQLAVIEMGANHQKEIEGYCRYTLPTLGIITNVGKAHLEGFGGPEGVRKGKGELYDFLRSKDVPAIRTVPNTSPSPVSAGPHVAPATAFVLHDSADLRHMSRGIPHIITYGTHDADITGDLLGPGAWYAVPPIEKGQPIPPPPAGWPENAPSRRPDAFLAVKITHGASISIIGTQLVGDYNLPNVLAAVAVGKHFGVPDNAIRQAIELYNPSNSRSQMIERDGNHIILDAYNANPSSMFSAIENFARMALAPPANHSGTTNDAPSNPIPRNPIPPDSAPANSIPPTSGFDRKILILGAMAELGPESLNEHRAIVDLIAKYPWRHVVLVGGDFEKIDHPYLRFANSKEASRWLSGTGFHNMYMLIKGSRSSKMEEVLAN